MTPKQKAAHIQLLKDWCKRHGYTEDRFGHFKKKFDDGSERRYKFTKLALRREVLIRSPYGNTWKNTGSNYYSKIKIGEDDRLSLD